MTRNKILALALAAAATASTAAFAESFGDRARVLSARPVMERIPISREQCWNESQRVYEERRVTRTDTGAAIGPGTVLGAIVGGVAGHQVGSGRGNDLATGAGAVAGALIGNSIDRQNGAAGGPPERVTEVERVPVERNVQRCRTVQEVRETPVGYDVRYEYNGRQFMTRTPNDPGRFIHVRVDLQPVVEQPVAVAPPPGPGPRPPQYR